MENSLFLEKVLKHPYYVRETFEGMERECPFCAEKGFNMEYTNHKENCVHKQLKMGENISVDLVADKIVNSDLGVSQDECYEYKECKFCNGTQDEFWKESSMELVKHYNDCIYHDALKVVQSNG